MTSPDSSHGKSQQDSQNDSHQDSKGDSQKYSDDSIHPAPELTVVVPTFNEAENVELLAAKITSALDQENWEIIFVDDNSPDGTHDIVRSLAAGDSRIRLIHRIGRTGLSSACLEGMFASIAPYVAIIDADLQHDETLLKTMLTNMRQGGADLIVASRKTAEGSFGEMPGMRVKISQLATWMANRVLKIPLTDPMSGNFMIKREVIDEVANKLYGQGFKLLLDICANTERNLLIEELPYKMRARQLGESKLGLRVILEYGLFLFSKAIGQKLPIRFIKFCLIGGIGVVVHLAVLGVFHKILSLEFLVSQIIAAYVAMSGNYILNNRFTFSDKKKSGVQFWIGMLSFYVICSFGAFIGITAGEFLHSNDVVWWLAGVVTTLVAAIWNYSVSSVFTWRRPQASHKAIAKTDEK